VLAAASAGEAAHAVAFSALVRKAPGLISSIGTRVKEADAIAARFPSGHCIMSRQVERGRRTCARVAAGPRKGSPTASIRRYGRNSLDAMSCFTPRRGSRAADRAPGSRTGEIVGAGCVGQAEETPIALEYGPQVYSDLSACIGSMRAARSAGTRAASSAAAARTTAVTQKVVLSVTETS